MKIAWETLAAAVLIAAAILFVGRYQISANSAGNQNSFTGQAYRLDRWTGKITKCVETPMRDGSVQIECPVIDPAVQKA